MRKTLALALFICGVFLSGCNSISFKPGYDPFDPMKVAVASPQSSVVAGGTLQLTATVTGDGPTTVEWSVNGITGGNSAYGTISATGLYTAPAAVSADLSVAVTATSLANTSVSATVAILVEAPTITSVAVVCNPASILTTGASTCTATVQGTGKYSPAVTWSATGGTISSAGVFTPSAAGNATITATSVQDATRFGSVAVTVALPPTITSVSVTCLPSPILVSQTSICTANVTGAGAYNPSVTWSADSGVIDQSGNYKAPTSPVTATIRAVSNQDSTKFGTTTVTVNPAPTVTGVTLSCTSLVVPVGQTSQCTATVQGTGAFTQNVVWEVNGVEGGTSSIGTISASGLYQAPATAPSPYVVAITATSAEDATKSAWLYITIEGPIDSSTHTIGPAGGTITLADRSSVTIPAGVLQTDTAVTLSSSTVAIKPTNTLFQGIGPSLTLSFDPALTASSLSRRGTSLSQQARPQDSSSTPAPLTFIVNGDPSSSVAQIQGAFGVADVNNGTSTFYSLPSTYNASLNQTALSFDTSLITAGSTVQIGLSNLYQCPGLSLIDAPKPQIWGTGAFFDAPPNTCATGDRALIMMHGMLSCPNGTFANNGGVSAASEAASPQNQEIYGLDYGSSIYAIEYPWLDHVASSAQAVVPVLASLVGSTTVNCPNIKYFDIEAHSEGVVVSMTIVGDLDPVTRGKLGHFVSVAGPIDGTPLANAPDTYISVAMNVAIEDTNVVVAGLLWLIEKAELLTFIEDLKPDSPAINAAKTAIGPDEFAKYDAFAGNAASNPDDDGYVVLTNQKLNIFGGVPNDGAVPVSSALAQDQDSDPSFTAHQPYEHDHTHLVNNAQVMSDVLAALSGQASNPEGYTLSTSQSTFNITAGSQGSFILTATSTGGFSGTVSLSPINVSGITGSWSTSSISVTSGTPGTSTYSFSTSTSTPAGTYTLSIQSVSVPLNPVTASVTVVVSAPSGTASYSVSMGGSGKSVVAGNSATFSLTATSINGFSNTVSLPQASMNITGASSSWFPSSISITPSSQGTSTLTIYTSTSTPANTYPITEYMLNGQSASVLLTVTSSSGGGTQAPTATTGSASASTNSATLYGTVNPNGSDTHFYFEYGTSSSNLNNLTGTQDLGAGTSAQGINANTGSLSAGTQYYFRVVAYNSYGTTTGLTVPFSTTSAQTGPTAHFTMTGQGQTFSDGGTLPLSITSGGSASANFTNTSLKGSAPITTYVWKSNGVQYCGNSPTCGLTFTGAGSATITLTVTDSNGKQSSPATGTVVVTISNPTPTISNISPSTFTKGQGGGVVAAIITGTGFTSQSYQQYSVSGGAQWAWAQVSPWNISSTSMTIDVNTGTAETQLWRVCAAQVSNPVCSNSVTVTVH